MARMKINRFDFPAEEEGLTLYVHGTTASDLEERFYRACKGAGMRDEDISFQVEFSTVVSIPEEDKVVDFVIHQGRSYPVDIDGEIGHKTEAQKASDQVREVLLNEIFSRRGMALLQRVSWPELQTQELADAVVKRMFG
ncbi:MAG: hypothetical protein JW757_10495 [Anaerolineales bacterium]|nr:hypothetical protein [Anaerolineales bacterium]